MLHIKLPCEPVIPFLGIQPKRNENIGPHKNVYMNVHSSIMRNRKKWKQCKCPSTDGKTKCGISIQ